MYYNTNLIARRGYAGRPQSMSGTLDDIWSAAKGAVGSVVDFYGNTQKTAGEAAALQAQNAQLTAALAGQKGGIDTTTLLMIGGIGLAAVLLLRK